MPQELCTAFTACYSDWVCCLEGGAEAAACHGWSPDTCCWHRFSQLLIITCPSALPRPCEGPSLLAEWGSLVCTVSVLAALSPGVVKFQMMLPSCRTMGPDDAALLQDKGAFVDADRGCQCTLLTATPGLAPSPAQYAAACGLGRASISACTASTD